jgi:hypothetical protein
MLCHFGFIKTLCKTFHHIYNFNSKNLSTAKVILFKEDWITLHLVEFSCLTSESKSTFWSISHKRAIQNFCRTFQKLKEAPKSLIFLQILSVELWIIFFENVNKYTILISEDTFIDKNWMIFKYMKQY